MSWDWVRRKPPVGHYGKFRMWLWSKIKWRWRSTKDCEHPKAAHYIEWNTHDGMPFGIKCDDCGAHLGCYFLEFYLPRDFPSFVPSEDGKIAGLKQY